MFDIDDTDLIKAANEALARPLDFGYYGDLDLFGSWGLTICQHRDSDVLERSNYRCILRDLDQHIEGHGCDPDDYRNEVHSSHWGHGDIDQVAVRVLIDPDEEIVPSNITGAFRWVASVALYIAEQDPVYDESDYSDKEYAEALDIVTQNLDDIRRDAGNDVDGEADGARLVPEWITAEDVYRRMRDNDCDTPRENYGMYGETADAVWELADDYSDGYAVGFTNGQYSAPYAIDHGHRVPTAEQRAQSIDFHGNAARRAGWLAGWTAAIEPQSGDQG